MAPPDPNRPQGGGSMFAAEAQAKFREATRLFQSGQAEAARALLEAVAKVQPGNAEALHLLGVIAAQSRRYADAAGFFGRAVRLSPSNAGFHFNHGVALHELGQLELAVASYDKALSLRPDAAEAYFNRGNASLALRRYDEAVAHYRRAADLQPNNPGAHNNCGLALEALQRFQAAVDQYDSAIALNPAYADAHYNRANALLALKRPGEAVASYDRALALQPRNPEAYNNRGNALQALERLDEAVASFDSALQLRPAYAEALNNRGNALQALNRFADALKSYSAALACNPHYVEAYCNRAQALQALRRLRDALSDSERAVALAPNSSEARLCRAQVLFGLKRFSDAIVDFDAALAMNPDRAATHNDRGNALRALKRYDEAVLSYEAALRVDPQFEFLLGTYLHTKMELCDWRELALHKQKLAAEILAGRKAAPPFVLFALFDDPHLQRLAAQTWANSKHPSALSHPAPPRPAGEKIRIGYFSADFHDHATAYLATEMFEAHDRDRFELYAFSFGPDASGGMRARISSAFKQFIDVRSMSDDEVVALSRTLGIDIAVDLKGYTEDSRPALFARRCAPLQISFLGYPGTIGADFIDYIVADHVVIAPANRSAFTEKVIYLPGSYQPNDSKRQIADRALTRVELGLPATGFVFCGFHANYKITPETFDGWMRILAKAPRSVLWLLEANTAAKANLSSEAEARGIDSSRLVFAKSAPLSEHLARLRHADLFLDTLPCCAHTTASDALWAGLPVLTRIGEAFAGRVAASLLTALELSELITDNQTDYEAKAIELAASADAVAEIRAKLRRHKSTSSLFHGAIFARNLEAAYETILTRYRAGLACDDIQVSAHFDQLRTGAAPPEQQ